MDHIYDHHLSNIFRSLKATKYIHRLPTTSRSYMPPYIVVINLKLARFRPQMKLLSIQYLVYIMTPYAFNAALCRNLRTLASKFSVAVLVMH